MNLNDYQIRCQETAIYPNRGRNLVYPTLGLMGEAGEVAEKVKKFIRDWGYCVGAPLDSQLTDEQVDVVTMELGDVLWYVAAIASELGISLTEVAMVNLGKLSSRQARQVLHGSGDRR